MSKLGPAGQTLAKARRWATRQFTAELHQVSPFLPHLSSFLGFGLLTVVGYQTEVINEADKGLSCFKLESSGFTMLRYFLQYSKVNQLYIYIFLLFLDFLPI